MKNLKRVEVKSRAELRKWLKAHSNSSESIWLVTYKKSHPWYLDYDSIVEEALCFGWVDSLPRALDADRKMLRLSPRAPRSAWSKLNRERVAKLIKAKKMTPAGLRAVEIAKKNGSLEKLAQSDPHKIPADLSKALAKSPQAQKYFSEFPPSSKKIIFEWINQTNKTETRAKRIAETVELAKKNIRAHHYRQPRRG